MSKYDRRKKVWPREETLGTNKYQFCVDCEYIRKTAQGNTCPARFNPYEPQFETDGSPRTDGRQGCPKNEKFMKREREKLRYATRQK